MTALTRPLLSFAISLLLSGAPVLAQAQEAAPAEPSAAEPTEASVEPEQAAQDARYETAKRYFEKGVKFFDSGNYNAALTEFEKAHQHLEGHPKRFFVLDNIGQCHERLFRYDLALASYRRYLSEGGAGAEDHATVEATIRALEGLLARLVVRSNVRAEVWVDERKMGEAPGTVLIPGGRHVVELRARGYESAKKEISVTARDSQEHAFTLEHIDEYQGLSRAYFWTGAVLTGAALAGGTYFAIKAQGRHDDLQELEKSCGGNSICVQEEDRKSAQNLAVTADVFFAGAAAFGIGTGLLYFMTDWEPAKEQPRAAASVGRGFAGVSVAGAF